jgi:hypothetical protein
MIGCMLNRLTLLASTDDPKLAELFARTEPKRLSCSGAAQPDRAADWVSGSKTRVCEAGSDKTSHEVGILPDFCMQVLPQKRHNAGQCGAIDLVAPHHQRIMSKAKSATAIRQPARGL